MTAALESDKDPLKDIDPVPVSDSEEHAVAGYSTQVAAQEANGEAEAAEPAPEKALVASKPKPKPTVKRTALVRKATKRRINASSKRRVAKAVAPKKAKGGGIKVYDSAGKPVGH